jgi:hypothetical protein
MKTHVQPIVLLTVLFSLHPLVILENAASVSISTRTAMKLKTWE